MKKYEVQDRISSYLPEDSERKLVWSDEFDGIELDRTKWDYRLMFRGERFDAYTDQGVVVKDRRVELHRTEIDGRYVSPQLQTGYNTFDRMGTARPNPWGQDGIWPFEENPTPKFVHRYRSAKKGTFKRLGDGGETVELPFVIQGEFEDDAFICDYVRLFDKVS